MLVFVLSSMLGMGLVLFTVKAIKPNLRWPDRALKIAFWGINIGLGAMTIISILPVGLMQTWAAVEHGYWYARSSEFLHTGPRNAVVRKPGRPRRIGRASAS